MTENWLDPIYDADGMRLMDRYAIDVRGISGLDLMESAAAAVAKCVLEAEDAGRVSVVCGRGNNGGDGFAAARLLREAGREVQAVVLGEGGFSPDADTNLGRARAAGVPVRTVDGGEVAVAVAGSAVVVDAIFGTGFAGEPRGIAAEAIDAVNGCSATVLSVDVPSGVDASTGEAAAQAVRADVTATFHAEKVGHWISPGKLHTGRLRTFDIGIPADAADTVSPAAWLISDSVVDRIPRRGPTSTKFTSGVVTIVGGSPGLTGSVVMASRAAMRAGAGYVRLVAPESLHAIFEVKLTEVMTVPAPHEDGFHSAGTPEVALKACERATAAVLGPGLGRAASSVAAARRLVREIPLPLVVDADGLFSLAGALDAAKSRVAATVVTPHSGEMGRLLGVPSREVDRRRLASARAAADAFDATVVLKGADTIVCAPDGRAAVSRGATPALATAGTGDVLAGIAGALLSKGMDPFTAAAAAVRLQALAAERAARRHGTEGLIAGDVVDHISPAIDREVSVDK